MSPQWGCTRTQCDMALVGQQLIIASIGDLGRLRINQDALPLLRVTKVEEQ